MNKKPSLHLTDTGLLLSLALGGALLHILLNRQYGFHRDELDILANARHLAWGYVAYPPFTPFIARIGLELFGNSLQGVRLFAAISQGIVLLLAGLMARDLGGRRRAQVVAAIAAYIAPVALMGGTLIQYMSFDFFWWVVMAFFTVRLLASANPRYWLGIGAAIGLGMMTKFTIAFWVTGLVVAVLVSPARKYLRTRWLWMGAALALLIYLPNLVWQIQHDFISLDFLQAIHARDIQWGRSDGFLLDQLYATTNPFTLPLWVAGLAACLFSGALKRFRLLGWMFLVTFGLFLLSRGRGYYTAPAYVMVLAAGSVWVEQWLSAHRGMVQRTATGLLVGFLALGSVVGVVLIKPVAPVNSALWKISSGINPEVVEMIGWAELTSQVAEIYQALPAAETAQAVILAGNYGEAGALNLYGAGYDLPPVISGANSFWGRGYGDFEPATVIVVGFERSYAEKYFAACAFAGAVTNAYGVKNEESTHHTGLYVCRQPRRPWSEMWPDMQWFQ